MILSNIETKHTLKRAWAQIHLDRLRKNFDLCRGLLSGGCEAVCVVKANCYGHGAGGVIPCLEKAGAKWYAVSNLIEAIELRELGVKGSIIILGYTPPENAPQLAEYDIIQAITEYEYAEKLCRAVGGGEKIRCHIAVDTGMTRIGIRCGSVLELADECERIAALDGIDVEGIFTHLSVADSDSEEDVLYTARQTELICSLKEELSRRGKGGWCMHFLNSAGAAYHFDPRSELARIGIMLYGLKPDGKRELALPIEPVMELKACVSQVKTVEAGVSVSYGRTFVTERPTKIATVSIGYADGYPRALSNRARVIVRGKYAKVIGRVCMDQLMIDVSGIDGVREGDIVTLFGRDGDLSVTADELAAMYGSIGYELVCGISQRVPRIYLDGEKTC